MPSDLGVTELTLREGDVSRGLGNVLPGQWEVRTTSVPVTVTVTGISLEARVHHGGASGVFSVSRSGMLRASPVALGQVSVTQSVPVTSRLQSERRRRRAAGS